MENKLKRIVFSYGKQKYLQTRARIVFQIVNVKPRLSAKLPFSEWIQGIPHSYINKLTFLAGV